MLPLIRQDEIHRTALRITQYKHLSTAHTNVTLKVTQSKKQTFFLVPLMLTKSHSYAHNFSHTMSFKLWV